MDHQVAKKEAGDEEMWVQIHSQLTQHFSINGFPHSLSLSITSPCFISLKHLPASGTILFICLMMTYCLSPSVSITYIRTGIM